MEPNAGCVFSGRDAFYRHFIIIALAESASAYCKILRPIPFKIKMPAAARLLNLRGV